MLNRSLEKNKIRTNKKRNKINNYFRFLMIVSAIIWLPNLLKCTEDRFYQ